ncbi:Sec14 domain containing protein [Plasmodium gallinaceum]|uniref:Sec14 domain containing protein n=1 Tax=Plasmodium gallinaceum TaxID=5849 RepID=A0A1J1GRD0_PLAGA|nr:Sec14 domain containing protein [Plasmodium gallinaceum]CRG93840.1 Sec14 domain containing protein [Plasmodium gallinaceum]
MELSRGKVVIEKNVNEYTIDENVFFFEPNKEDVYDKNLNLRYIFHNTFISTEEEIAICEFKKYCKNKSLKINKTYFENECLRYLYSAQFDFAKALDLIKSNYEFRVSNILPIKEKDVIDYINKGVMYWHGRDKKCRPILIINLLNVELLNVEKLINLFFFCFEFFLKYLCIPGKIENYISIIDCSGISISKFPMSTFMKLIETMNSKYRCRLFRMYIIDAPKLFKTFGKSFLSFAPNYMTKKLKILDNNYSTYLKEEILETQLEKKYGGIQEIKNNMYYPFSFYPNCYVLKKDEERGKKEKKKDIHLDIFNKVNKKIYEILTTGYSMHLKLIENDNKELMKQHSNLLNEEYYCNNNKKKKKKKNLSKKDLFLNKSFINSVANVEYYIINNSFLKNNKYINSKNKYIVNIESFHKWLFKIKYLFLSNITINYLTNRFPFLVNHLIIKSNFKSMHDYFKYIESIICTKESSQYNNNSSVCHRNSITLNSTYDSSSFNIDEENINNLNKNKLLNNYTNNNCIKERKTSISNVYISRVNNKKHEIKDTRDNNNLDGIKKDANLNDAKMVEINIYNSCASIFDSNVKKLSDKGDTISKNIHKNINKKDIKGKTNSYCKIKATKSLFHDEIDKYEKLEYDKKSYLKNLSLDCNEYKTKNEFNNIANINYGENLNVDVKNEHNNNDNKNNNNNNINSLNSINSDGNISTKKSSISIKSILPKRFDYAFSKSKNNSSTSISTKFSKKSYDKLYEEYKYEDENLNNHLNNNEFQNKVSFFSRVSSSTGNVTNINDDELINENKKNMNFLQNNSNETNNINNSVTEKKSKRKLNKIKIIGLQFFNKHSNRS